MHIQRHSSEIGWNHFESEWSGLKNVTHFSSTWKWLIVSFELSGTEYQHHSDDKMMSRTNRDERHRENGKKTSTDGNMRWWRRGVSRWN